MGEPQTAARIGPPVLERANPLSDRHLQAVEPDLLRGLAERLESRLAASMPTLIDEHDLVAQAMREAVLSPGKRIRPLLLLACARSLGVDEAVVLDAACSLEMIHAASLVLDDLPCMDDSGLRRGRPTIHVRYGEDVAALTVVALTSQAFMQLAASTVLDGERKASMVQVLGAAVGHRGLVSGQLRDLRPPTGPGRATQAETTNQLKTGALFHAAFELAAIAARLDAQRRWRLQQCAFAIGQAFQLLDDLKDDGGIPGMDKPIHQDEDKPTLFRVLGRGKAIGRIRAHAAAVELGLAEALPEPGPVLDVWRLALQRFS